MTRRWLVIVTSVAILVVAVAALRTSGAAAVTVAAPPSDLSNALAPAGYVLSPPVGGVTAASPVTSGAAAVDTVLRDFAAPRPPVVYLGNLTATGAHIGDESTPLLIQNRLVYAVQITGLSLYPMEGGPADANAAAEAHHEMAYFVDATTGQLLLTTTVR